MGAWGAGHFENDDAMDWTYELERSSSTAILDSAFNPLLPKKRFFGGQKEPRYIEAPDATIALAAAEVVAALAGRSGRLPDNVRTWVSGRNGATQDLKAKAREAVGRILDDSELKQLWEESDDFDQWQRNVEDTLSRLA
jgi:hypothetical protein